jgi:predicted permease
MKFFHRLRTQFRKQELDNELSEELAFHIAQETEENITAGMSAEEARFAALRKFGGVDQVKEECRDAWGVRFIETLVQDIRFGLRMLAKNPGFAAVAIISLALGIGANTTVFSIVDQLLLRPWQVKDPGRLVAIQTDWPQHPDFRQSSYPDYLDIRSQATVFTDVVAYDNRGGFISGEGQGREVSVEVVSPNYFGAIGAQALLGRAFSPQAEQAAAEAHSVIVSYGLWQKYFHGDPLLPGKTTLLDGKEFAVIGITRQDFCGLRQGWTPDIWVTTGGWATMVPGEERGYAMRANRALNLAGRLRPGTSLSEARVQLQTLAKRLALTFPSTNQDVKFLAFPASEVSRGEMEWGIYLMAMVSLVLLISCANVANLLLAQTERRQREITMRKALGAGRWRLTRQLLTEGLVLSLTGGLLGVLLASWLMKLVPALAPGLSETNLMFDDRVFLFTAAISVLTALTFGLAPGIRAAQWDLITVLKGEGSHAGWATRHFPFRSLLVAGEIALSVILLTGSGLLLRSLQQSQRINPGFDPKKNVVMLSVAPPELYGYGTAQAAALYPALAARVETVPGVMGASYARRLPLTNSEGGETQDVIVPGVQPPAGTDHFKIRYNIIAPRFFATLGTRLLAGREFNESDRPAGAPVVIVNDVMARRFWPDQNSLGKSIQIDKKRYQVIGVVKAGTYVSLHETAQPYLFLSFTQVGSFECVLFVETSADPRALLPNILKETAALDKHLPIVDALTFKEYMQQVLSGERSTASLLVCLSVLGMFLAAVGLYASVAYLVSRRTHEIGIRVALGARRSDVLRLVLGQGLRLSGAGAVAGLAGALAVSRLMSSFLYGVQPTDPLSYIVGIVAAVGISLLASCVPARRATKVDPMVALRYE